MTSRLTPVQWLICVIAAIGFAFDIYELLMLPLIVAPALRELVERRAGHAGVQPLGRAAVLDSGDRRRHLRPARRLPDRPARPAARADVEHPALRVLGVRRRLQHEHLAVPVLPLHDVHRRLRRVRGGRGLAGRAVPRPEAAREGARLHAGVLVDRRRAGDRRPMPGCSRIRRVAAGDLRRPRGVALHADVGRDSGAAADHHPAVPAGVAGLAGRRRRRHAQAAEPRRDLQPGAAPRRRSSRR